MRIIWIVGVSALLVGSCSPPNRVFGRVPFPPMTSMTCTLRTVHSGVLNPNYYRDRGNDSLTFTYRQLDPDAETARVGGNNGIEVVDYLRTEEQMQFIETTATGNLTVTTVFAPPEMGEAMPAVHSRHVAVSPANVSISQFAGECIPSEPVSG